MQRKLRKLWIATGALSALAAVFALIWVSRPEPMAPGTALGASGRWELAWPGQACFRKLPGRFDLSARVTFPSGGDPAVRLFVNAVGPAEDEDGATSISRAAYVDVTPSGVTVGRIEGGFALPLGTSALDLDRDAPHEVTVKRRGERLIVSLTTAVDERLAIVADEPHLHGGRVALGLADGADAPLYPLKRLPELPEFSDDFMRTPDEPSPWEVRSGEWKVESIAVPSMSANAFSFRGRTLGYGGRDHQGAHLTRGRSEGDGEGERGALASVGHPRWDSYRVEASVEGEEGGSVGLALAGRFPDRYALFRWRAAGEGGEGGEGGALRPSSSARPEGTRTGEGRAGDARQLVIVGPGPDGGPAETVVASAPGGYVAGQWYRLAAELDFGCARILIDGHEVLRAERPEFVSGAVGLWCSGGKGATFDDVLVVPSRSVDVAFAGYGQPSDRRSPEWRARWEAVRGKWKLESGKLVARASGREGGAKLVTGSPSWRRVAVEAEVDGGTSPDGAGVVVNYRDEDDYILLRLDGTDCVLERILNGHSRLLDSAKLYGSLRDVAAETDGSPMTLRLESDGGHLAGFANGRRLVEAYDESSTEGRVGLWCSGGRRSVFRRFKAGFIPHRPPVSTVNVVFEMDSIMTDWASESADWYRGGETTDRRRVYWHHAPFHGDVELTVDVPPMESARGGERLVLGIKKSGSRPRNGYGWALEQVAAGPVPGGRAAGPNPAEWRCRLFREGKTLSESSLESGFTVESVFVRKRGKLVVAGVNGEKLATYRDEEPLDGPRVAILAEGVSVRPGRHARVRGDLVLDYLFNEAPTDWRVASGEWDVGNRWTCDPRWSFLVGKPVDWPDSDDDEKLVAIWCKRRFPGDVSVEFFIGPRMDPSGRYKRYEYVRDFNVTIAADGKDISSGYTFMFGGFGNTRSAILRGNQILAETHDMRARYPTKSMTGHQRWFHMRAERSGSKLRYRVYFNHAEMVALEVEDPEPLTGDRVAVWSYDCPIVIARMRIAGSADGRIEDPGFRAPGRVRTPYDAGRADHDGH